MAAHGAGDDGHNHYHFHLDHHHYLYFILIIIRAYDNYVAAHGAGDDAHNHYHFIMIILIIITLSWLSLGLMTTTWLPMELVTMVEVIGKQERAATMSTLLLG